jgi:alpha-maltose-1-phosphate synthase
MVQRPNPVLLYHFDGYRVARQDLKGRHSAGESFFTAFLQQSGETDIYGLCLGKESATAFQKSVSAFGRSQTPRVVARTDTETLKQQGVLNLPAPGIAGEARTRSFLGDDAYAVCGVTHTISSRTVIESIADIPVAPVQPWDALICTSKSVHDALSGVLSNTEDYLRERMGAQKFVRPMMPVIPLGIHTKRFTRKDGDRSRWRKQLRISDDTTAILFFGRLSFHAKASPLQMAQAAEEAAKTSGKPFAIIWCGWFNDDFQRRAFMETAKSMAPSVPFHHADGRDADTRFSIWAAADIFCSLSDNIQESFGLTVIEAMAAGLPVVVSNWNGYREAIEHEKNGILIDSFLPAGSFKDIGYRYISDTDTYDVYIGAMSQFCFLDLKQTATAFGRLASDPELRSRLATAARQTVERHFDWKAVMPRYFELWQEQLAVLERGRGQRRPSATIEQPLDPGRTFDGFSSKRLDGGTLLVRGPNFNAGPDQGTREAERGCDSGYLSRAGTGRRFPHPALGNKSWDRSGSLKRQSPSWIQIIL